MAVDVPPNPLTPALTPIVGMGRVPDPTFSGPPNGGRVVQLSMQV
jgi:hypothetical protein